MDFQIYMSEDFIQSKVGERKYWSICKPTFDPLYEKISTQSGKINSYVLKVSGKRPSI